MSKKLAIIVPYRDRQDHLRQFLPHMSSYFAATDLSVSVHIVEQTAAGPFNRGKLSNVGYMLAHENADYVCIHDVDYLPIDADYSWSQRPARLIWHGLTLREDYETFFGGVVLFDNAAFERVNGFPNCYWAWGGEDMELGQRCKLATLDFEKRDGTYRALPHKHAGLLRPGVYTPQASQSLELFGRRRGSIGDLMATDGLTSLKYKLIRQEPIEALPSSFHHVVEINSPDEIRKWMGL